MRRVDINQEIRHFRDTHVSEMMKKLHAEKQNETNDSPIPSAGAAINPQSDLAKKIK